MPTYSQLEYIQACYKAINQPWNIQNSYPKYYYVVTFPLFFIYKFICRKELDEI